MEIQKSGVGGGGLMGWGVAEGAGRAGRAGRCFYDGDDYDDDDT